MAKLKIAKKFKRRSKAGRGGGCVPASPDFGEPRQRNADRLHDPGRGLAVGRWNHHLHGHVGLVRHLRFGGGLDLVRPAGGQHGLVFQWIRDRSQWISDPGNSCRRDWRGDGLLSLIAKVCCDAPIRFESGAV